MPPTAMQPAQEPSGSERGLTERTDRDVGDVGDPAGLRTACSSGCGAESARCRQHLDSPCRPQGTYARLCQGVNGAIGADGTGGIHRAGRRGWEPPRVSEWIGEDLDGGAVPFAPPGVSPRCPMRCCCTWFESVTRGIACCELTAYGHNHGERIQPHRRASASPRPNPFQSGAERGMRAAWKHDSTASTPGWARSGADRWASASRSPSPAPADGACSHRRGSEGIDRTNRRATRGVGLVTVSSTTDDRHHPDFVTKPAGGRYLSADLGHPWNR